MGYIDAINDEIFRKREEFDLPNTRTDDLSDIVNPNLPNKK